MIPWLATPVGHFATHMLTAAALGAIGWGLWWYANRGEDVRESVIALDDDVEALWDRVEEIVTWLYALTGLPKPDDGEPTEEHAAVVDDEPELPDTVVSHPADLGARMLALLHRAETTAGRHRTDAAEGNVHQLVDGISTRLLPQLRTPFSQAAVRVGEELGPPPLNKGE